MHRRDLFRILGAGAVLPILTPETFAFFQSAQPAKAYALRTLNAHQNETVLAMIDQIIPATDTPGAKGARVNEFIDVILTEWATEEERKKMREDADRQLQELQKQPPAMADYTLYFEDWQDGDGIKFPRKIRRAMACVLTAI